MMITRPDEALALACEYARQCAQGSGPIVDFDQPIEVDFVESAEGSLEHEAPFWEITFQRAVPIEPSFIIVIVSQRGKVQWHPGPYF